jgi:hypothetical protein
MHWWTRFIALTVTRTWQLLWHLFIQKFLFCDCISLANMHETLFSRNSRIKISHKPTNRATGLVRNCRQKTSSFLGKPVGRTHGGQPSSDPCFYSKTSLAEPIADLVSILSPELPKYYINRSDELVLPHVELNCSPLAPQVCAMSLLQLRSSECLDWIRVTQ